MNKYKVLLFSLMYLMFASLVAMELNLTESNFGNSTFTEPKNFGDWLSYIGQIGGFFFKMITFQISSIPPIFTLIFIFPATFLLLVVFISIIRGVE